MPVFKIHNTVIYFVNCHDFDKQSESKVKPNSFKNGNKNWNKDYVKTISHDFIFIL